MPALVLTEKLDGQNNCLNRHGVFARSHIAPSQHPWDKPLWDRWQLLRNDLKSLEVFGENLFGIHSIAYSKLESYFYVFAIRENSRWLSWEEVNFYASLMDLPTVPEIQIEKPLIDFCQNNASEIEALDKWLTHHLQLPWTEYIHTPGMLGGYEYKSQQPACEGLVVRNAQGFKQAGNFLPKEERAFDQLFKLVRPSHVKTEVHWTKTWKSASIINCEKYKWYHYNYRQS